MVPSGLREPLRTSSIALRSEEGATARAGVIHLAVRRFKLQEELGSGPRGRTWSARSDNGSALIVKRLESVPDASEMWPAVGSPHLVPQALVERDGEAWAVTVAEQGATLDQLPSKLRRGFVVVIGLGILSGLARLHQDGLVHGSLKPGNVVVGTDGSVRLTHYALRDAAGEREKAAARLADVRAAGVILCRLMGLSLETKGSRGADSPIGRAVLAMAGMRRQQRPGYEATHACVALWEAAGRLGTVQSRAQAAAQLGALVASRAPRPAPPKAPKKRRTAKALPAAPAVAAPAAVAAAPPPPSESAPVTTAAPEPTAALKPDPLRTAVPEPAPVPAAALEPAPVPAAAAAERVHAAAAAADLPPLEPAQASQSRGWRLGLALLAVTAVLCVLLSPVPNLAARVSGHGNPAPPPPAAVSGVSAAPAPPAAPAEADTLAPQPLPVATPTPTPTIPPPVPLAPEAAGSVRSVALTARGACQPGATCGLEVAVGLVPARTSRDVRWSIQALDSCSGAPQTLATGQVRAAAGWTLVIDSAVLQVPPSNASLLAAVVDSPDRAASQFLRVAPGGC